MIKNIDHIAVIVPDIDAALAFWRDALGLNLTQVEAVPRGCPPDFDFLPDLDTFYSEWLGRPLPDTATFEDKTLDKIAEWSS